MRIDHINICLVELTLYPLNTDRGLYR